MLPEIQHIFHVLQQMQQELVTPLLKGFPSPPSPGALPASALALVGSDYTHTHTHTHISFIHASFDGHLGCFHCE